MRLYVDSENFMQKYKSVLELEFYSRNHFGEYCKLKFWRSYSILVVFKPQKPHLNSYWDVNHLKYVVWAAFHTKFVSSKNIIFLLIYDVKSIKIGEYARIWVYKVFGS